MKEVRTTTRIGVHETNSSSSHSIAVTKDLGDDLMDTLVPDDNGTIYLEGGDFQWEFEKYNDAATKAAYILFQARHHSNPRVEKINTLLGESESAYQQTVRIIKEQTGATNVELGDVSVDHESVGIGEEAFVSDETLRHFIFNPKSVLYTGNDNSDQVWDKKKGVLVNYNDLEDED